MKHSAFDDFSESTQEILDFTRCQRPDGSFYGTSGQCRKGAPADAKEKEASKGKSGGGPQTQAQAQSARRAAVVQALEKEKLPTNPVQMKAAVTRAVNKSAKGRSAQENVDIKKAAVVNARNKARTARENVSGKSGAARTTALKAYDKAQSDLNKKGTALDRAQGQLARVRKSEQRQIERRASQVAIRAQRIARNKEPKVQDVMGATQRLGDSPIQP